MKVLTYGAVSKRCHANESDQVQCAISKIMQHEQHISSSNDTIRVKVQYR